MLKYRALGGGIVRDERHTDKPLRDFWPHVHESRSSGKRVANFRPATWRTRRKRAGRIDLEVRFPLRFREDAAIFNGHKP